jgi:hypothetical protein
MWSGFLWRILGPPLNLVMSGYYGLVMRAVSAL